MQFIFPKSYSCIVYYAVLSETFNFDPPSWFIFLRVSLIITHVIIKTIFLIFEWLIQYTLYNVYVIICIVEQTVGYYFLYIILLFSWVFEYFIYIHEAI